MDGKISKCSGELSGVVESVLLEILIKNYLNNGAYRVWFSNSEEGVCGK